ncbi:MAG: hypothetical protein NPIRA05_08060 [Nitrospirales bacterium]|nr:MAG: hypothetical protein NPIRA05_08060 [Nitrospirales bacterium]
MKIAIDATPVLNGRRAAKRHSKNLLDALFRLDTMNTYTLFYSDWRRRQPGDALFPKHSDIRENRVPIPGRFLHQLWRCFALPKAEWMLGDLDILYAPDLYFPPARRGVVLSTIRGLAYHIILNHVAADVASSLQQALRYTLKHADYLVAVSKTTRNELVEHLDISPERIFVVQHGVDSSFRQLADQGALAFRLAEKFGITSPYILYVGEIGRHKNVMGILRAYLRIREHGFSLPLIMAGPPGSGWEEARTWVANNGLDQHVYFLGHVDQDTGDLTDLYNGAVLFVFPSFYEGWTAPPLEAMACGTPVITSNCSSLPETVEDAAIQVDPYDIDEFAAQMERVLDDESLRQEMIEKGLKHVSSHTWEKAGRKLMNVFHDIHERGPWRRK